MALLGPGESKTDLGIRELLVLGPGESRTDLGIREALPGGTGCVRSLPVPFEGGHLLLQLLEPCRGN